MQHARAEPIQLRPPLALPLQEFSCLVCRSTGPCLAGRVRVARLAAGMRCRPLAKGPNYGIPLARQASRGSRAAATR
jgi:hypothetical protein